MSDEVQVAVAAAAAQLYAVPLAEFVASRKALAAAAKAEAGPAAAKEILALRKPTVTAWAMNLVPRGGDTSTLAELVGLGARMRAAQSHLDTANLTSMRGERDAAVAAYVEAAVAAAVGAGGALSASGREEVRASAIAALADESAAKALASGQLTRALSYSGFGEVDLSGAVGVTSSGSIMSVLKGGKADAGVESESVEEPADDDELTDEELAQAVAEAKAAKARAKARRAAEAEVGAAETEMKQAQADLDAAENAARAARKAVIAAQKRLDAARAALS